MRNRAKCTLCGDIIESLTSQDTVDCSCGEISVMGGQDKMGCAAKNWDNFLRIDDNDQELKPKVVDKQPPTKEELMSILEDMIEKIESMPDAAMSISINHYDLVTLLYWMRAIFNIETDQTRCKPNEKT